MVQARFWECSDPQCALRFPEVGEALPDERACPRCGAPMQAAAHLMLKHETLPEGTPRPPQPLPAARPGARLGVLDNLRSAWNVGSIFRSAEGAGWTHLCLVGFTPTPEHPGVGKTALGAERRLAWSRHPNAVHLAWALHTAGWELWALEVTPEAEPLSPALAETAREAPIALFVGNERAGVDPAVLALCQRVVALPMRGQKRSLNVAVAFAVAAYLLLPPSSRSDSEADSRR